MGKTVYFLGAGASYASEFKLPTMETFFDNFSVREYPNLTNFIQNYFLTPQSLPSVFRLIISTEVAKLTDSPFEDINELIADELNKDKQEITLREMSLKLEEEIKNIEEEIKNRKLNLEEIFSYLDLSLSKFGRFGRYPPNFLEKAKEELLNYIIIQLLQDVDKEGNLLPSEKFKILFNNLNKEDTIITLNYDILVETTLNPLWEEKKKKGEIDREKMNKKEHPLIDKLHQIIVNQPLWWDRMEWPFYTTEEQKTGAFLKLHGSINWVYCPNESCRHHQSIFSVPLAELRAQLETFPACRVCGQPVEFVIVPPVMHKVFDKFPKLGFIWSLARRELFMADKIVIIGVSFSPSDYYLRWLFKSAIADLNLNPNTPKIEVVNKDEKVCEEIERITRRKVEFKGDFDRYIENIKNE